MRRFFLAPKTYVQTDGLEFWKYLQFYTQKLCLSKPMQGWEQSAILNQENMLVDSKMEKSNF